MRPADNIFSNHSCLGPEQKKSHTFIVLNPAAHKHIILYAEDDPDDLFLVKQAFEPYENMVRLEHASDGFELLERLGKLKTEERLPCLIILDINMPGMDGREALIRIKQNEEFQKIPAVMFTTSSSETDKAFAKKWDAGFITKPLMYAELEELATTLLSLCMTEV